MAAPSFSDPFRLLEKTYHFTESSGVKILWKTLRLHTATRQGQDEVHTLCAWSVPYLTEVWVLVLER